MRLLALGAVLLLGLTQAPAVAAAGGLAWHPCEQDGTADCATLTVPVDWADPARGTFPLAVARRRATDQAGRIGALLINPGGPGASGVSMALSANRFFGPDVVSRFDLIGFDPRGVGASQPIKCTSRPSARPPTSQAEFQALAEANRRQRADCRQHSGPIFDHADTMSVVQDVDALRAALGESKISYYGASYGTLLGQQYAERHGDRVRSMVLDGVMDHSLHLTEFSVSAAASGEDALATFADWCQRQDSCALHGKQVLSYWDQLLDAADQGRLVEQVDTMPASSWYVIQHAYGSLIRPDFPGLAQWLATLRITASPVPQPSSAETAGGELTDNPRPAVFCQDWTPRVTSYADWQRITGAERAAAPHLRYSSEAREAVLSCVGWPEQAANPPRPVRLGPGPRILLVNPLHDPATGYSWAQGLHRQAPQRTVLLRYDGTGHTAYFRTDCVRHTVDDYLVAQTVPATGTSCPAA
ncbi:alpha/beta hydrolase [Kutzneria viridogrisea]|uniref:Pimeloyl-ACP methyl ester carboxylesterase n=1 Tax=Kutzneria viridogrisea TaxID=47990 RepID=A0ABR6BUN7_9PSEU|nr:pimeloyl-ACP methyl ester carboxylesterase [Kutzneria viridogrisea]